jgi:hypothetical protein
LGPHHFSASFEVEEGPRDWSVRVDVADRVRVEEPWLACTYHVLLRPDTMIDDSPRRVAWDVAGVGRVALSSAGPPERHSRVVLGELPRSMKLALIALGDGEDALTPIQVVEDPEPGAPSLRCRYHWTFEAAKDRGPQTM